MQPGPEHTVDGLTAQPTSRGGPSTALWKAVRWSYWLAASTIVIILLPRLLDYATHSWSVLFFPWQLHYDEGPNANAAWLMAQSVNVYRPHEADHFISANYMPLYYAINAASMKLWGLSLLSGRLISFVSALGIGAILWIWVYMETKRHLAGALSSILWFSLGPVYVWSTLYKQDMLALALSLAGALMVAAGARGQGPGVNPKSKRPGGTRNPKWIWWAIVPLALAVWTRQASIVAVAAVSLFLLAHNRGLALRWLLIMAGVVVVPFAAFDLYTNGGFHQHTLSFRYYGTAVQHFVRNLRVLWTYETPLILCGVAFTALSLWADFRARKGVQLSALYLLVTMPATLLIMAMPTANYSPAGDMPIAKYNEFLELLALLCLAMGLALGTAWRNLVAARPGSRADWAWLTGGVLFLVFLYLAMTYRQTAAFWYPAFARPLEERALYMEEMSRLVRSTPGDVLAEDSWLLLKSGKVVLYDDPATMAVLAKAGAWDQSALLQDLQRRKFSYIITELDLSAAKHSNNWSAQSLAAIQTNYDLSSREFVQGVVSVPRNLPGQPETKTLCDIARGPVLVGYRLGGRIANRGDTIHLSLYWADQGQQDRSPDLKVSVAMAGSEDELIAQVDLHPGETTNTRWLAGWARGAIVQDNLTMEVPIDLPYGRYQLLLGEAIIEEQGKRIRLAIDCAEGASPRLDNRVLLTEIEVVERWGR